VPRELEQLLALAVEAETAEVAEALAHQAALEASVA
jgi:hypothetical protein